MTVNIQEGQLFKIPLNESTYAVGIVARVHRKRRGKPDIIFAYFFGPFERELSSTEFQQLKVKNSVMRLQCSVLFLRDGSWPIIGQLQSWRREEWPLPVFYREDLLRGTVLVRYNDNLEVIDEFPFTGGDIKLTDKERFSGSEAVEIRLRQLFRIA